MISPELYLKVMSTMTVEEHELSARIRSVIGEMGGTAVGSCIELLIRAWGAEKTIEELTKMVKAVDRVVRAMDEPEKEEVVS